MSVGTYALIASNTLNSSTGTVTLSSISSSYTDLIVIVSGVIADVDKSLLVRFNSDSGTNYSTTYIYGTGSSVVSGRGSNENLTLAGRLGNVQSSAIIHLQDYSNTTTNKTIIARGNNTVGLIIQSVSLWRSTAAINSLTFTLESASNFNSGTTFRLYGIEARNQ